MKNLIALLALLLTITVSQPATAHSVHGDDTTSATTARFASLFQQAASNQPPIGGPVTLTDINGQTVTEKSLIGKHHLIFFGFSECKTECPVAMQQITRAYNQLIPEEQKQLQVVFISVDPKNDTLPVLKKFITAFNPAFTAWRGEKPEVDAITRNYLAYYAIKTDGKQQYQVNHSSYIYLMGPQGTYLTHFRGSDADATLLETLKSILKNTTK